MEVMNGARDMIRGTSEVIAKFRLDLTQYLDYAVQLLNTITNMPPRINLFNQALAYRPRTACVSQRLRIQPSLCRNYASDPSKDLPVSEDKDNLGPNMQTQEHVSEEAAKMAKATGGEGPDLSVGTPVQDVRFSEEHDTTIIS